MKKLVLPTLIILLLTACTGRYTETEVNATVAAKIREMAYNQKVYVTVETIIVKDYVVVTPTQDQTFVVSYLQTEQAVPTPLPYDWMNAEQLAAMITGNGLGIRRFLLELGPEETNRISTLSKSATAAMLYDDDNEYNMRIYEFADTKSFNDAYAKLKSEISTSTFEGHHLLRYQNIILELNGIVPEETVTKLQAILNSAEGN